MTDKNNSAFVVEACSFRGDTYKRFDMVNDAAEFAEKHVHSKIFHVILDELDYHIPAAQDDSDSVEVTVKVTIDKLNEEVTFIFQVEEEGKYLLLHDIERYGSEDYVIFEAFRDEILSFAKASYATALT